MCNTGIANVALEDNQTVFSESDGNISCCVGISGLPAGGLGCDITVELQTAGLDGAINNASRLSLSMPAHTFCL